MIGRGKPHQAVGTVNVAEIFVAGAVISSLLSAKGQQTVSWGLAIALDLGGALTLNSQLMLVCGFLPKSYSLELD